MMIRASKVAVSITLSVTTMLVACGGSESSPEQELRDWVSRGELAAEEENRRTMQDMISVDYVDARGNDYEKIGATLRAYFLYQNSITLLTSIDEIALSGETAANVMVTVGMAGTNGNRLGFDADAVQFEFELVKPDDDWVADWCALGRSRS